MFLDCVTTILMMTPVVIRICEVISVQPAPVLIIMLIVCNLAGIATPVGDPPNMMIMQTPFIKRSITFFNFTIHMTLGVLFAMAMAYVQLRFFHFRNRKNFYAQDVVDVDAVQKELKAWKEAAEHLSTEDDLAFTVTRKIDQLDHILNASNKDTVLKQLEEKVRP